MTCKSFIFRPIAEIWKTSFWSRPWCSNFALQVVFMCRGTLSWFGEVAVWRCGFMQWGGSFHPKQQTEPAGIHFKGEIAQRQWNNTSIGSVGCASIYICSTAILLWNKLFEVYEISLMIHLICLGMSRKWFGQSFSDYSSLKHKIFIFKLDICDDWKFLHFPISLRMPELAVLYHLFKKK